jgi:anion-transporting  ArsA/GET3 family ATPase
MRGRGDACYRNEVTDRGVVNMKTLLKRNSILILLGTGGVGKTTVAAALGLAAAGHHLNTALITVDPARRLRDALGLHRLGGSPTRISAGALRSAGLDPAMRLSAMQLDVKGAWDTMVERFAKNPATRRKILDNPFYKSLTEEYAGSEAYAALQQLYDLHQTEAFEIEIVDTPPAAHAFEFLQAPARLARLLDSRTARWLFTPSLSAGRIAMRLANQAARFVVRELERFAGSNVLSTIADFFNAASEAIDAMVDRLHKTEALLRSPEVHFVLVTTAEEDRLRRARELIEEMDAQGLTLNAIVINRFLDEESWSAIVRHPGTEPRPLDAIRKLRSSIKLDGEHRRGVDGVVDYLEEYRTRSLEDLARVESFARHLPAKVRLAVAPEIEVGVSDLAALSRIAHHLVTHVGSIKAPARESAGHRKHESKSAGESKSSTRRAR